MTREPERIARILSKIETIWLKYPDLRFFQFVMWLEHEYSKQNDNFVRKIILERDQFGIEMPLSIIELFHLEDTKFENFLNRLLE